MNNTFLGKNHEIRDFQISFYKRLESRGPVH